VEYEIYVNILIGTGVQRVLHAPSIMDIGQPVVQRAQESSPSKNNMILKTPK